MRFFFLIFLLALSLPIEAEIQAKLVKVAGGSTSPGDIFDAKLKIWPASSAMEGQFRALKGTTILGLFYVIDIQELRQSKNNADLFEADLILASARSFSDTNLHVLDLGGKQVSTHLENFNPTGKGMVPPNQKFIFSDIEIKKFSKFTNKAAISLTAFLIAIIAFIFVTRKRKQRARASETERELKLIFWREKFDAAEKREDFEFLYKNKDEWIEVGPGKTAQVQNFLDELNRHQFKRKWNGEEYHQVRFHFETLKEMF